MAKKDMAANKEEMEQMAEEKIKDMQENDSMEEKDLSDAEVGREKSMMGQQNQNMSNQQMANQQNTQQSKGSGSEPVFEGGPTRNQVENWKQEYGDIYMTEFDSETYIWRTLSRIEYKNIMNAEGNNSEWFSEEQVAQFCVLWPENYGGQQMTDGKAGIPSVLSDQIMAKSGFVAKANAVKL